MFKTIWNKSRQNKIVFPKACSFSLIYSIICSTIYFIQSSNIWMLGYKSQHTIKLLFEALPIFIKPWTILVFSLVYFQLVKAGVSLHLEGKFSVANKNFGFWANHDPGHKIQCTCGFTSFFLSNVLPFIQYITEGITIIRLTQ